MLRTFLRTNTCGTQEDGIRVLEKCREKLSRKSFLVARVGVKIKIRHECDRKCGSSESPKTILGLNIISFLLPRIPDAYDSKRS